MIMQAEWRLKVLGNKIQELKDKERTIKTLRLSEQQKDMKVNQFLNVAKSFIFVSFIYLI